MKTKNAITPHEANCLHGDIFKMTGQAHAITAGLLTDDNLHSLCPEHTSTLIDMLEHLIQDIEYANGQLWEAIGPVGQPTAVIQTVNREGV